MALETGARLGPYVILGSVGAGGMGEVYRGRDERLERDVAIKVIPASFARDPDRVARFEREARAVAALTHPNILTIHDTGIAGETLYVVMELLAGETLGERLRQGPLPIRKACEVGQLIARGLAAAHEKNVVHRDLKPDNVFLTSDGQVKILDFGLARSLAESTGGSETRPAITDAGGVLGTVGYMAPEQVRGLTADARADLFALGVVLYEMVSGQRAFSRGTAAETMTAILNDDAPDLQSAARPVPAALDRVIRHCLEKNPAERFQTARDVAFALDALSGSTASAASLPPSAAGRRSRERAAWAIVTVSLAALAAWLAFSRPTLGTSTEAYRASVVLPEGVSLATGVNPGLRFAISPDGQQLAFIGESKDRGRALWIQSLKDASAVAIEGVQDAEGPFWSPDSKTVGFFADRHLMKVNAAGGRPLAIASGRGTAAWSPNGQEIILADEQTGVRSVSVADGSTRELIPPRPGVNRIFPAFLPDGRRFMFGQYEIGLRTGFAWYGSDLNGTTPVVLKPSRLGSDNTNAMVASGYVLWARDQNLLARPVDLDLSQAGASASVEEPAVVVAPVEAQSRISAAFSASQTGVLVYQPAANSNRSSLLWLNRRGERVSQLGVEADYSNLEVSPDGTRLLVSITDPSRRDRDIWLLDLIRGVPTRLTFERTDDRSAVWSRDGQSIVYRGRDGDLFTRPLGRGEDLPLLIEKKSKDPDGWSSDGKNLLYRVVGNGNDIWIKPATGDPYPFIATSFNEPYGQFSPDGRWVAYVSDEAGTYDVYVTGFPSGQGKTRVSPSGGAFPRWRKDGKELYYLAPDGKMMMAAVKPSPKTFDVETAKALFQTTVAVTQGSSYVVSDDGQRFLINSRVPSTAPPSLGVIFNWPALVRKRQ